MFELSNKEVLFLDKLKDLSEQERSVVLDILKRNSLAEERFESKKLTHQTTIRALSIFFGSSLGAGSLYLASHAINSKASLLELAALFTPIAALAGVFLWGFQRKD